jgi:predicted RNA binding protein YcfA (HicA-like mRNA interferase family)
LSPALPVVSGRDVVKALGRRGFDEVSQRGSHVNLRNPEGDTVIVPMHRELAPGTLRSILRQAGIDGDELSTLLR